MCGRVVIFVSRIRPVSDVHCLPEIDSKNLSCLSNEQNMMRTTKCCYDANNTTQRRIDGYGQPRNANDEEMVTRLRNRKGALKWSYEALHCAGNYVPGRCPTASLKMCYPWRLRATPTHHQQWLVPWKLPERIVSTTPHICKHYFTVFNISCIVYPYNLGSIHVSLPTWLERGGGKKETDFPKHPQSVGWHGVNSEFWQLFFLLLRLILLI